MILSIVVAAAENGVIGDGKDLPWHLPDDFKFFKGLTTGHSIIMGRKTFESLGKPLPKRRNIVLTRDDSWVADGAEVFHSLGDAVKACAGEEEVFVIGGASVYIKALQLDMIDRVYLTRVHGEPTGDTVFDFPNGQLWNNVHSEFHPKDEKHEFSFTFQTWERPGKERRNLEAGIR